LKNILVQILINSIINYLWNDLTERLKSIEEETKNFIKSKKEVLKQAHAELCFFFLLLDEGLISSDAVLASSLWTLIYSLNSCKYLSFGYNINMLYLIVDAVNTFKLIVFTFGINLLRSDYFYFNLAEEDVRSQAEGCVFSSDILRTRGEGS